MVGHGKNVVIIQFFKWRKDIGEYKIREKLAPYYEIYQFGRPVWLGKEEKVEEFGAEKFEVEKVKNADRELAKKGLDFAKEVLARRPHLLVLDEICLAVHLNLLEVDDVLEVLERIPHNTTVVMTGRYARQELIDRADFVNVVQDMKMPRAFKLTEGIQY
jgi:cob(I)alamin adenosyltransferase